MDHKWKDGLLWALIASTGVLFALATPTGLTILGSMPQVMGVDLNRKPISIPASLTADRTLVLVSFQRGQGRDIDSWVQGMGLTENGSIAWVRMFVRSDPGDVGVRAAIENRLQARYPSAQERSKVVPVFTDQEAFMKSVGLSATDQISALILNRNGEVLARVEGPFDATKKIVIEDALKAPI